jgi:hypothetical protein
MICPKARIASLQSRPYKYKPQNLQEGLALVIVIAGLEGNFMASGAPGGLHVRRSRTDDEIVEA